MSLNFNEMCRTCANKSNSLINIFEEKEHEETLAYKIFICTQIIIKNQTDRPSRICANCIQALQSAYDFHNLVESSEKTFEQLQHVSTLALTNEENTETLEDFMKIEIDQDDSFVEDKITTTVTFDYSDLNLSKIDASTIIKREKMKNKKILRRKANKEKKTQFFECYKCKQQLSSFWKTQVHLKQHDAEEKFKCIVCGIRFIQSENFDRHLCQGTDIKCAYCDEKFAATITLLNHLDQSHEAKTLMKCEKCGRFFSMPLLKQIHMLQHHSGESTEDNKPFVCTTCNKGFATKISLRNHEEIHSDEKRK